MHSIKFISSSHKAILSALVAGCVITAADAQTVTNNGTGTNVGAARAYNTICVYGWTTNPLVEYYITRWPHLQHL